MRKIVMLFTVVAAILLAASISSYAYLTEDAVQNTLTSTPLPTGNGNVPGTHRQFTLYTIENIDFQPGIKNEIKGFQNTIL